MSTHTVGIRWAAAIAALFMTLAACSSPSESEGGTAPAGGEQSTVEQPLEGSAQDGAADGEASEDPPAEPTGDAADPADKVAGTVTLLTHDSFAVDPDVLADFEAESGITVRILAQGNAGEMVSKAILTQGNPLGDVIFGIDNTLATKALDAGALAPYTSPLAANGADRYSLGDDELTAIDFGDVCVNVDHEYVAQAGLAEPATFEDLAKPEYRDMFVAIDPGTSSAGLAFLFGTIAHFGEDGWQGYWQSLKDNGVSIAGGWTDAYTVSFSGSSGHGDRPLVVSYASSPPSEVPEGSDTAPTGALLDTCFRQVEYAGVLAGTANPEAAGKLIDFLLSAPFQEQIPAQMWVYPVDDSVPLPEDWAHFAPVADNPASLDPAIIDANRPQWIDDWSDLMR